MGVVRDGCLKRVVPSQYGRADCLGNVATTITFEKLDKNTPTYGYGIGTFNASLASLWLPMTDLLFSTNFMSFLSDGTRVIDITPPKDQKRCDFLEDTLVQ